MGKTSENNIGQISDLFALITAIQDDRIALDQDVFNYYLWPSYQECVDSIPDKTLQTILDMAESLEQYECCQKVLEVIKERKQFDFESLFKTR